VYAARDGDIADEWSAERDGDIADEWCAERDGGVADQWFAARDGDMNDEEGEQLWSLEFSLVLVIIAKLSSWIFRAFMVVEVSTACVSATLLVMSVQHFKILNESIKKSIN